MNGQRLGNDASNVSFRYGGEVRGFRRLSPQAGECAAQRFRNDEGATNQSTSVINGPTPRRPVIVRPMQPVALLHPPARRRLADYPGDTLRVAAPRRARPDSTGTATASNPHTHSVAHRPVVGDTAIAHIVTSRDRRSIRPRLIRDDAGPIGCRSMSTLRRRPSGIAGRRWWSVRPHRVRV